MFRSVALAAARRAGCCSGVAASARVPRSLRDSCGGMSVVDAFDGSSVGSLRWSGPSSGGSFGHAPPRRLFLGLPTPPTTSSRYSDSQVFGWSPEKVYEVVSDVDSYDQFVPWCVSSRTIRRYGPDETDAELVVGFQIFSERYVSHVKCEAPRRVVARVAESTLFDHLDHDWKLEAGPTPGTCALSFDLDFAFKSPLHAHVAGMFLNEVAARMLDAFHERCILVHGKPLRV